MRILGAVVKIAQKWQYGVDITGISLRTLCNKRHGAAFNPGSDSSLQGRFLQRNMKTSGDIFFFQDLGLLISCLGITTWWTVIFLPFCRDYRYLFHVQVSEMGDQGVM